MGLGGRLLGALLGEKELSGIRVGMFAGQCYELLKEFQRTGSLPQGVQLMVNPETLLSMVESRVRLNPAQRAALKEVAEKFNTQLNRGAEAYGKKKAARRNRTRA